MTEYLRSAKDRKNAILNDTPDTKFYFESQKFSDIPNYQNRSVENPYQRNDWGAQEVRKYSGLINATAARYSIDPDVVKAIIYTEVSRGFYGFAAQKAGVAGTWFPGNISTDWQKLIPGSDVRKPADNIELTTKLISQIAKRLDDPSIENIYSLYNGLSHDRTYVNKEAKTTPYFAKMAIEAKAWEKDDWYSPEFPKDPPREVLAPDRREFFDKRFGKWGSSSALDRPVSFDSRFGNWSSSPASGTPPATPAESFDNRFGNWGSAPAGGFDDTDSPVLRALEKYRRSAAPDGPVSTSAQGAPPTPPNLPIGESAFGDRSENAPGAPRPEINSRPVSYRVSSAFPDLTPRNRDESALPSERAPLLGIFSGKPMSPSRLPPSVWGLPNNSDGSGDDNSFNVLAGLAFQNPTQPAPPQAGSKPVRSLGRRIVNQPPASMVDIRAPAVPLAPSDDPNFSGGLLGGLAALAAIDPPNPNQPAPPDDEQEQVDIRALEAKLSSSGNIRDAVALYNARKSSRRQIVVHQA